MNLRLSRGTVFALLFALLFQLGAAAAAGLPSQSCCGTCDGVTAPVDAVPAQHCADATGERHRHEAPPHHRHGNGSCPVCGDHAVALAPFVLFSIETLPSFLASASPIAQSFKALPPPIPHRLERPPRVA